MTMKERKGRRGDARVNGCRIKCGGDMERRERNSVDYVVAELKR